MPGYTDTEEIGDALRALMARGIETSVTLHIPSSQEIIKGVLIPESCQTEGEKIRVAYRGSDGETCFCYWAPANATLPAGYRRITQLEVGRPDKPTP